MTNESEKDFPMPKFPRSRLGAIAAWAAFLGGIIMLSGVAGYGLGKGHASEKSPPKYLGSAKY